MNTYLRILAIFYLYGALVHLADLRSLGHHLGRTHGLAFPEDELAVADRDGWLRCG